MPGTPQLHGTAPPPTDGKSRNLTRRMPKPGRVCELYAFDHETESRRRDSVVVFKRCDFGLRRIEPSNHGLSLARPRRLIRPPTGGSSRRFTPPRGACAGLKVRSRSPKATGWGSRSHSPNERRGRSRSRPFRSRLRRGATRSRATPLSLNRPRQVV